MSHQSQSSSSQPQSTSSPSPTPTSPSAQAGGTPSQQGGTASLPISPFTGKPYDPEWGTIIQKGDTNQQTFQQIMKPEIERKADQ